MLILGKLYSLSGFKVQNALNIIFNNALFCCLFVSLSSIIIQHKRTLNKITCVCFIFRLCFGLCCSLLAMYVKGWRSQCALLGAVKDSSIYVNIETHKKAIELPNIKIFQYIGAINFASAGSFKRSLYKMVGENRPKTTEINANDGAVLRKLQPHAVIIDLSCVSNIDIAACKVFAEIQTDFLISNTCMYAFV